MNTKSITVYLAKPMVITWPNGAMINNSSGQQEQNSNKSDKFP